MAEKRIHGDLRIFSANVEALNEKLSRITFEFDGLTYETLGVERLELDNIGVLRLIAIAHPVREVADDKK